MPIEIDEMVIRARVDPRDGQDRVGPRSPGTSSADQQDEIVRRCVEEVMRILADKRER
jgi:hypothetical protein